MKHFLLSTGLGLTMLLAGIAQAQNLIPVVEYKIPKQDLLAFSSQGISVRLCADCDVTSLPLESVRVLHEKSTPISPERATELFVSRNYNDLSVFVDRYKSSVVILRFGIVSEIEDPIAESSGQPVN